MGWRTGGCWWHHELAHHPGHQPWPLTSPRVCLGRVAACSAQNQELQNRVQELEKLNG